MQRLCLALLLLQTLRPLAANSQNSSLRINTNLKAFEEGAEDGRGANVCSREEPYVEHVQVPVVEPVRVRTTSWCLEMPPRCASYKTEMRDVMKVQQLKKTRTVRFCCAGYEGNLSDSKAVCRPICRGGCGRGLCLTPDNCSCEEGYMGKHCTQRCDHDRWGLGCKNLCECQNDAVCDNKTGICHCIAGWAGQFCEQPCPPGTHGIMCRKACTCADKLCHPQTGACLSDDRSAQLLPNVTHVMLATLNSTIANLTHNLDHIAKKIGSLPDHDASASTIQAQVPEVILIKQTGEESPHTPQIILHQSSSELLENLHTAAAAAGGKAPDVIHVITNWSANGSNSSTAHESNPQLSLAGLELANDGSKSAAEHDANLLTTVLIILLIIMIAITVSFLYIYRRYHCQKELVQAALANGHSNGATNSSAAHGSGPEVVLTEVAALGKNFLKPLPELPRHSAPHQLQHSNDVLQVYDTPSNNSSIKTPPYAYARKESLYSVVSPKSRKGSLDSHLYDEIPYLQQHQHHHSYHSQPHRFQHATTAGVYLPPVIPPAPNRHESNGSGGQHSATHHVAHLIIPPQNSKFLQVPTQITARRIAHL